MASNNNEKKYVNGLFGTVFTFKNGGEVYKMSCKAEDFIKFIQENTNAKGYFNFDVSKQQKDPSKLSAVLNTFEPKATSGSNKSEDDDLPF